MTEACARLVYPVIEYGLGLRGRIADGEPAHLHEEQAHLQERLKSPDASRVPDFAGDGGQFLGIRYALVCWLDELFCDDSPFGRDYNNRKLEWELFRTNDRATKFWMQADLARMSPRGNDAIEAYFLCVMLGFRGNKADRHEDLKEWVDQVGLQIARDSIFEPPPETARPTKPWELRGPEAFRKMIMAWVVAVSVLVIAYLIIWKLVT